MPVDNPPLITVAILNWNGAKLLQQFLPSVVRNSPQNIARVVVIDNGSSDNSLSLVGENFPSVQLLAFPNNAGFAGGYNRAIPQFTTPYVCLLNSDVEVTEGWLDAPLELLNNNPMLVAVQPKICSYYARSSFEYAGAAGGCLDKYAYPYCRGRIFNAVEADYGQYNTEQPIAWASGAALFIRRDSFLEVGGFDENFFSHMEEIDLAWRLNRLGYSICYTPNATVYHVGGATLSASNAQKTYLNFRNNLVMIYKNLPPKLAKPILRMRWWLDRISALFFFLQGKTSFARAVLQAWRGYKAMKPCYTPPLLQSPCHILAPYSIVWQHFVLGKKTFSALPQTVSKHP